jgi:hypothetical protein
MKNIQLNKIKFLKLFNKRIMKQNNFENKEKDDNNNILFDYINNTNENENEILLNLWRSSINKPKLREKLQIVLDKCENNKNIEFSYNKFNDDNNQILELINNNNFKELKNVLNLSSLNDIDLFIEIIKNLKESSFREKFNISDSNTKDIFYILMDKINNLKESDHPILDAESYIFWNTFLYQF